MKIKLIVIGLLFLQLPGLGQTDNVLERLRGLSQNGIDFYNIDGVTVTSRVESKKLTTANIFDLYKEFVISESSITNSDKQLKVPNYVYERTDTAACGVVQYTTYYFIENPDGTFTTTSYGSADKNDKELQRRMNMLIMEKKIPQAAFGKMYFNTIDFAGRNIELGTYACRWANVNSVQWMYHGQMNWTIHKDFADAEQQTKVQYLTTKEQRDKEGMEDVSDEMINVVFEGIPTKARKIISQIKGDNLELLKSSGSGDTESLTIYYVTVPLRGNYVSCVMSHWNNDFIEESGLPALLEKVMKLDD